LEDRAEGGDKGGPATTGQTGPRTEEGKAALARNALKHGSTARRVENAVDPELKAQHERLRAQHVEEFRPEAATENTLLDMVVLAAWQLYRIREMEAFSGLDFDVEGRTGWRERMAWYRVTNERLLFSNLSQLRVIWQARAEMEVERTETAPERVAPGVRVLAVRAAVLPAQGAGLGVGQPRRRAVAMRRETRR
jgi:hypothetical protein